MKFNFLTWFLLCERGETEAGQGAAPGNGQGAAPAAEGSDSAAGEGGEGQEGQGGEGAAGSGQAAPKYGDFGDTPNVDEVYGAYSGLKEKTTATEKNLAALRQTLESVGVRAVYDQETGQYVLQDLKPAPDKQETPAEKKRRFDKLTHGKLFDAPVLDAIQNLVQDLIDDGLEGLNQKTEGQRKQLVEKQAANTRMIQLFPSLEMKGKDGKPNPAFNQKLYDRATAIWKGNKEFMNHPKGELWAVLEASAELGISATNIEAAKAAGYQAGKAAKKVISVVDGQQGKAAGNQGKMTREQYLSLSPEKREEYDKQAVGLQK